MASPRFLDALFILLTVLPITSANPVLTPPRPYLYRVNNWNTTSTNASTLPTSAHDNTTSICGSRSDAPIFTRMSEGNTLLA
ncbi:hypothetical protein QBC36DRAFT_330673, partial [Triangularia setosa]